MDEAVFLRHLGADVAIVGAHLNRTLTDEARQRGIAVIEDVVEFEMLAEQARVLLVNGSALTFEFVYAAYGCSPRTELFVAESISRSDEGYVKTDEHQRTSLPGLWAAGDVAESLSQISVSCGEAAIAATNIHNALLARELGKTALHLRANQDVPS